jgi:hypothetical protein
VGPHPTMLGSTTVRTLLGGRGGERYRQQSALAEVRRAPVMRQVGAPREALLICLRFWCATEREKRIGAAP